MYKEWPIKNTKKQLNFKGSNFVYGVYEFDKTNR